jgi:hypothetical protein
MNHYDDKEIEVMTDDELKQFLGIANKMLEKAKANQTKTKIALDQAQKLYKEIDSEIDSYWEHGSYPGYDYPYSNADSKAASKKVEKLEFKTKELGHEIIYLQRTIGRAKVELGSRESIKVGMPSFRSCVQNELDDMFGEV